MAQQLQTEAQTWRRHLSSERSSAAGVGSAAAIQEVSLQVPVNFDGLCQLVTFAPQVNTPADRRHCLYVRMQHCELS